MLNSNKYFCLILDIVGLVGKLILHHCRSMNLIKSKCLQNVTFDMRSRTGLGLGKLGLKGLENKGFLIDELILCHSRCMNLIKSRCSWTM